MVNFTPRPPFPRGKNPRYPLHRRLGGSRGGLEAVEKREKFATAASASAKTTR